MVIERNQFEVKPSCQEGANHILKAENLAQDQVIFTSLAL